MSMIGVPVPTLRTILHPGPDPHTCLLPSSEYTHIFHCSQPLHRGVTRQLSPDHKGHGLPPGPKSPDQQTLNRLTNHPTRNSSPSGGACQCVGVPTLPSKGSFEFSVTPVIRAGRPLPPCPVVAPQPVASSYTACTGWHTCHLYYGTSPG